MARRHRFALACAILTALAGPAAAQRSLFDQPVAEPASPGTPAQATPATPAAAPATPPAGAPATEAPAKAKPKPRPRPKGPVPARVLTISNASAATLAALEVSADGKSAKLARPVKAKGKAALKLPAFKSCQVAVSYSFEGAAQPASSEVDICKEKTIRLTDE